ncbi:sulfur carrier protein ThiS [Leuconostoc kimchii]|uniref:Thiamine biosynthesis protein ThiS n=2 Tax=Leuconostoc kimchii TaxID=136609 RepID=D5T245_LEUKI|nr:sulfur carrier protein ThiS [Leuconostoc kimchii]ADG40344.1 thiamine biosynthesis protein ThiS [Leuconostoc kimchii IMSNU 11154]QBR46837.1 sulfur carrier protein ThiS [Leuconostoc kimchii]
MITVNGKTDTLAHVGQSISELLNLLEVQTARVVVERNGAIVTREVYDSLLLEDQDDIEVISFVGGG